MTDFKKILREKKGQITILSVFFVVALFLVVATHYGTKTLSAVRAYVASEGQWTKAQKEATSLLVQYTVEQQPELYTQFQEALNLHKGYKRARETLTSQNPDPDLAYKGFQRSNLHPEDIELLIWVTQFHDKISYLEEAVDIWAQGDQQITELDKLGQDIQKVVQAGQMDPELRSQSIRDITSLDRRLTDLETSFSATMGAAARWVQDIIFWSTVGLGVLVIITGYIITRKFFQGINDLNRQLVKSESKFKKVLQNSRDIIYQMDFDSQNYKYLSPAVESMLGYTPEELVEKGPSFILDRIHPEDLTRIEREVDEMKGKGVEDHFAKETKYRIKTKEGNYIWVNNRRRLLRDEDGKPVAFVGSIRDISEQEKHEAKIRQSLKEKRTLLAEIHHRVKNNLAIISGLMHLQQADADEQVRPILEDMQARIQSIAMIHEKLYQTDSFSEIDMKEYVKEFTQMVESTYGSEQQEVEMKENLESFTLDITKAVPLGLILNELLNNAYKHGFPDSGSVGELRITMEKQNGTAMMQVADNGTGLPDDFSFENQQSLGISLIKTLTDQLDGRVEVVPGANTTFQVTFPITS